MASDSCPSFLLSFLLGAGRQAAGAQGLTGGPSLGLSYQCPCWAPSEGAEIQGELCLWSWSHARGLARLREHVPRLCGHPTGSTPPSTRVSSEPGLAKGGVCLVREGGEGAFGKHLAYHDNGSWAGGRTRFHVCVVLGPEHPARQPCLSLAPPVPARLRRACVGRRSTFSLGTGGFSGR